MIKISEQVKENMQEKPKEIAPKQETEKAEIKAETEPKKKKRGRPKKEKSEKEPEKIHVKAERLGKKKVDKEESSISVKNVAIAVIIVMILAALLYYVSFHGKKGEAK